MRTDANWIQTYSGKMYYPTDPRPGDVDPVDIAHHLSNICRYTGAVRSFYSVAQHCVLMSRMALVLDNCLELVALLHDGAEAYTGDFARPVKRDCPDMKRMDELNEAAVFDRFGLSRALPLSPIITQADKIMLRTERRDLMAPPPRPWTVCEDCQPLEQEIVPMRPEEAKEAWLNRWRELWVGR